MKLKISALKNKVNAYEDLSAPAFKETQLREKWMPNQKPKVQP